MDLLIHIVTFGLTDCIWEKDENPLFYPSPPSTALGWWAIIFILEPLLFFYCGTVRMLSSFKNLIGLFTFFISFNRICNGLILNRVEILVIFLLLLLSQSFSYNLGLPINNYIKLSITSNTFPFFYTYNQQPDK